MIKRPDVDALMAGELGAWLSGQTSVREAAVAKSNNRITYAAAGLMPPLAFLWFGPDWDSFVKFWLTTVACILAFGWAYAPRTKAKKDTKHGINAGIARSLGIAYAHEFEPGPGFARAKSHTMLPSFQRSDFEDLWHGDLSGRAFTLHEAHLQQRRGSGKNRRWVTVFRGVIITIGFTRQFHGTTLVQRAGKHRLFGMFGEKDDIEAANVNLARVDMVHPAFEDSFSVYSSDQVEARYLVHPTYVERLIALEEAFSGQDIRTLFKDDELTIVLEAKNMFESGSLDPNRDREMVEKCVTQFSAMAELASALNEPDR